MTKINTNRTYGITYLDGHGMIVFVGNSSSKRDSIGHNAMALFAYPNSYYRRLLLDGIDFCFKYNPITHETKVVRYPVEKAGEDFHSDTSRDHVNYGISALVMSGNDCDAKRYAGTIRRASAKFRLTSGGKRWLRVVANGDHGILFSLHTVFAAISVVSLNYVLRKIGRFNLRHTVQEYESDKKRGYLHVTKIQKLVRQAIYPTYAMLYRSFQLNAIEQTPLIKLAKRILLKDVEESNYVLRYFLSDSFTPLEVYRMGRYKPTASFRWSTRLDESNDRNLDVVNIHPGANLEYDILRTIYEKLVKEPDHIGPDVVNYW